MGTDRIGTFPTEEPVYSIDHRRPVSIVVMPGQFASRLHNWQPCRDIEHYRIFCMFGVDEHEVEMIAWEQIGSADRWYGQDIYVVQNTTVTQVAQQSPRGITATFPQYGVVNAFVDAGGPESRVDAVQSDLFAGILHQLGQIGQGFAQPAADFSDDRTIGQFCNCGIVQRFKVETIQVFLDKSYLPPS